MLRKILPTIFLTAILLVSLVNVAHAAPPNGVDHLRGRWDGVIHGLFDGDQPFVLMLDEFHPDPNDASATLYNGCMAVGADAAFAPVSARFTPLGSGNYDMTLFGTAMGSVIKLEGNASTNDATVTDDPASGMWQTANQGGDWSAYHHDRREPSCPAVQLGDEIYFYASVNAVVGVDGENRNEGNIIEGFSNIVSSGLQATLPDGSSVTIPFFTDLFSPNVNFVDNFRYLEGFPDLPVAGETYTYTLLDVFGQPIPGTTVTDVWYDCTTDAPRNVTAVVDVDGIHVTWDASVSAPGFDPLNFIGFYQIELYPDGGGEFGYGSNWIQTPEHLIPFAQFGGSGAGSPNGNDFGYSLSELPDGFYSFDVVAFSEAFGAGSVGLECQIRANDERTHFQKSGDAVILLP
ncbi:MAG: hypothetical protein HYU84_18545 [Chloroflexi bacterium]|nr:hypothetical protein [Chloroflexota bacterium]MBI3168083.1 hypothetical protein [Chloroflexota bacterium]